MVWIRLADGRYVDASPSELANMRFSNMRRQAPNMGISNTALEDSVRPQIDERNYIQRTAASNYGNTNYEGINPEGIPASQPINRIGDLDTNMPFSEGPLTPVQLAAWKQDNLTRNSAEESQALGTPEEVLPTRKPYQQAEDEKIPLGANTDLTAINPVTGRAYNATTEESERSMFSDILNKAASLFIPKEGFGSFEYQPRKTKQEDPVVTQEEAQEEAAKITEEPDKVKKADELAKTVPGVEKPKTEVDKKAVQSGGMKINLNRIQADLTTLKNTFFSIDSTPDNLLKVMSAQGGVDGVVDSQTEETMDAQMNNPLLPKVTYDRSKANFSPHFKALKESVKKAARGFEAWDPEEKKSTMAWMYLAYALGEDTIGGQVAKGFIDFNNYVMESNRYKEKLAMDLDVMQMEERKLAISEQKNARDAVSQSIADKLGSYDLILKELGIENYLSPKDAKFLDYVYAGNLRILANELELAANKELLVAKAAGASEEDLIALQGKLLENGIKSMNLAEKTIEYSSFGGKLIKDTDGSVTIKFESEEESKEYSARKSQFAHLLYSNPSLTAEQVMQQFPYREHEGFKNTKGHDFTVTEQFNGNVVLTDTATGDTEYFNSYAQYMSKVRGMKRNKNGEWVSK